MRSLAENHDHVNARGAIGEWSSFAGLLLAPQNVHQLDRIDEANPPQCSYRARGLLSSVQPKSKCCRPRYAGNLVEGMHDPAQQKDRIVC